MRMMREWGDEENLPYRAYAVTDFLPHLLTLLISPPSLLPTLSSAS
jgi:hypothetical protein